MFGLTNNSLTVTLDTDNESVHSNIKTTNKSFDSVNENSDALIPDKATPISTTNAPITTYSPSDFQCERNSNPHFKPIFNPSNNSLTLTFTNNTESVTLSFDSTNESLTSIDTAFTSVTTPPSSNVGLLPGLESVSPSCVNSTVTSITDTDSIRSPSPNLSFTTTTATPTSSQLFGTPSSNSLTLNPSTPLVYGHVNNLPLFETWEKWTRGYYVGDPFDSRVKASIFFDEGHQIYRCPFGDTDRILPPQASLELLPPECLPRKIRDIPCLAMSSSIVHTSVLGSGTLLPANMVYRRGLALAPFFNTGRIYYILCLHDDDDVFLIRVHERLMDSRWSSWKQLRRFYGKKILGALFSAGTDTFDQILEGVKRQHSVDRYLWTEPVGSGPIIWKSFKNPCSVLTPKEVSEILSLRERHYTNDPVVSLVIFYNLNNSRYIFRVSVLETSLARLCAYIPIEQDFFNALDSTHWPEPFINEWLFSEAWGYLILGRLASWRHSSTMQDLLSGLQLQHAPLSGITAQLLVAFKDQFGGSAREAYRYASDMSMLG
ncbi:hypothetical protein BDP27DRAFT_1419950 [Rhodocollybia butyracea]|uniref:Uncharacterized protein n=1 Tax=Rhodocollybia butyracea TaxID=206335 RepID=A0A9P5U815_9AGAR|nr:hypothetical protein BDP27DRAFT_1419950 [Rhodocollybia butyracea]